jgi:hypothetical protein
MNETTWELLISLCSLLHQKHSFRPINATREILQALAIHFDMSLDFLDLLSNFYQKITDLEETYCAPLAIRETTQFFGAHFLNLGARERAC